LNAEKSSALEGGGLQLSAHNVGEVWSIAETKEGKSNLNLRKSENYKKISHLLALQLRPPT
jgi:hypothetical protein